MLIAPGVLAENTATGSFSDRTAITQRLQQVQIELQQHNSDSDSQTYELLKRLESAIYHHQAALDFLVLKESELETASAAVRVWNGFDQPGPYTITFADELHIQSIELQHLQQAAEARYRLVSQYKETVAEQFLLLQSTERRLTEMAEAAETTESRQQALTALQHNTISMRTAAERVAYMEPRQRGAQATIATLLAGVELLELKLSSIEDQTTFSQSELESILQRIAFERARALESLSSSNNEDQSTDAQIAWLAEFLDVEERFWNARYLALSTTSNKVRKKALNTFRELSLTVDAWAQVGKTLANDGLLVKAEATVERELRDDLQRIKRLVYQVDLAISELDESIGLIGSLYNRVLDSLVTFWSSELYLVEDKTSVEGQKVTTYRAITVGKLIQLALILFAGWFTLKFLSRRIRRLANRRFGNSPETVNTIVRWMFGIGLGTLIVYALKTVNIPFTAFAFLGGTLAIGIGFGAQTIIKNFISGIILKLERPFKVGDLIELDDISGKIMRIGMRASIIEHFDGIETLVPNSALLDNRVDNWTFGRTAIRGSVSVGVAYGSSTRTVARTILAAATEHGQILDRPEPEVRFEDFGDSALIFRLLYWVDASKTQRERLDSDLRFMMERALNEVGITLAFPQRDIHFDSERPLHVEISPPSGQPKPESTDG